MPRLADAFTAPQAPPVSDGDFLVTCTCGLEQRLDAMEIDAIGDLTLYDCARCATSIVAVMPDTPSARLWSSTSAMTRRQEAPGHRRNGYVLGSRVDVALRPPGSGEDVLVIPATPNLFVALRNL